MSAPKVASNAWAPSQDPIAQRWQKKVAGFEIRKACERAALLFEEMVEPRSIVRYNRVPNRRPRGERGAPVAHFRRCLEDAVVEDRVERIEIAEHRPEHRIAGHADDQFVRGNDRDRNVINVEILNQRGALSGCGQRFNSRIVARGKEFFSSISGEKPSLFNKGAWIGKVMDWTSGSP